MDIKKELASFKAVAQSKGWNIDGETTQNGYVFYDGLTSARWVGWQAAKAQVVHEDLNYKQLYKLAIINSKTDNSKPNWAHVVSLGVGSGKAKELLRGFNIDPDATDMRKVIEAQEPSVVEIKINWGCSCTKCGASEAIISSTASGALKHGWFHDGDEVKCVECGNTGEMDAHGEDSDICWNEDEAQEQGND